MENFNEVLTKIIKAGILIGIIGFLFSIFLSVFKTIGLLCFIVVGFAIIAKIIVKIFFN